MNAIVYTYTWKDIKIINWIVNEAELSFCVLQLPLIFTKFINAAYAFFFCDVQFLNIGGWFGCMG